MKPCTVLYINPFAQQISGADESLLALIAALDKERFQAVVWIPPGSPYRERYADLGVEIICHRTPAIRRSLNLFFLLSFLFWNLVALSQLMHLLRRRSIDVVHANMEVLLFPGIACAFSKTPCIYHVRGTSFHRPAWLGRLLTSFIYRSAAKVVCISDAIHKLFHPDDNGKVITIYNPIDTDYFKQVMDKDAKTTMPPQLREFQFIVGTAGRVNPRKNLEMLIEAAKQVSEEVPTVGFMIVGKAEGAAEKIYYHQLTAMIHKLDLKERVIFTGQMQDMRLAYSQMDLCCLLSHSEGFGRVLAEAQSMGVPVIGVKVGGIPEAMVEQKTGLLIAANNATALSDAILKLVAEPSVRQDMAVAAREHACSRFSASQHAETVMQLYDQVLTKVGL